MTLVRTKPSAATKFKGDRLLPSAQKYERAGGISSDAVNRKTGKSWSQWFRILDAAGARRMSHKEIVAFLSKDHKAIGGWWLQMVTVAYEQERGLRKKHEKPDGFEISVSRTIEAPVSKLFRAWKEPGIRMRWLSDPGIRIRKSTLNKSMRANWIDGKSHVNVYFNARGKERCQVVVQHFKLKSTPAATKMKQYWSQNLDRLKEEMQL